jgi:hypothetical protein
MRAEQYIRIDAPKLGENTIRFHGIGAGNNETLGKFHTVVNIDGRDYPMHVHVVEGKVMKHELLLGTDFLDSVQITMDGRKITIKTSGSIPEDDAIREVCRLDVVPDEVTMIDETY